MQRTSRSNLVVCLLLFLLFLLLVVVLFFLLLLQLFCLVALVIRLHEHDQQESGAHEANQEPARVNHALGVHILQRIHYENGNNAKQLPAFHHECSGEAFAHRERDFTCAFLNACR
eukprot:GEZU01025919.1.p1 GENE.GEZU01025919.1~~GEZU01025919.1.p1  ORF type:complete len:116 (+),score=10.11 GEZU01025919.1:215-562(+)